MSQRRDSTAPEESASNEVSHQERVAAHGGCLASVLPQPKLGERLPAAWVAAAQARREALFAKAERRRRLAGSAGRAAGTLADILPFSIRSIWPKALELGPRPRGCQWIYGDGPFTDADKCGAPAQFGRSYCRHHQAQLLLADDV